MSLRSRPLNVAMFKILSFNDSFVNNCFTYSKEKKPIIPSNNVVPSLVVRHSKNVWSPCLRGINNSKRYKKRNKIIIFFFSFFRLLRSNNVENVTQSIKRLIIASESKIVIPREYINDSIPIKINFCGNFIRIAEKIISRRLSEKLNIVTMISKFEYEVVFNS